MQQLQQVLHQRAEIGAPLIGTIRDLQGLPRLTRHHGIQQIENQFAIRQPEHVDDGAFGDCSLRLGDRLVEQRQAVAHRAIGGARDLIERGRLDRNALSRSDAGEMRGQLRHAHAPQVEPLAA